MFDFFSPLLEPPTLLNQIAELDNCILDKPVTEYYNMYVNKFSIRLLDGQEKIGVNKCVKLPRRYFLIKKKREGLWHIFLLSDQAETTEICILWKPT